MTCSILGVLDYFAQKQKRYIHIIRCICKRITRVAQAATDKLDLIRHSETLGRNISYIHAQAAPTHATQGRIQLAFEALPPIDKDAIDAHAEAQIRVFWQRLYIILLVDVTTEVGATWLELFILFHMRGGSAVTNASASKRHLRDTHAKSFREFQRRSKGVFLFAAADEKPLL